VLNWRVGFRTAALIAKVANRFASDIRLRHSRESASAKSIMEVMMLPSYPAPNKTAATATEEGKNNSGLRAGSAVAVAVRGPDARAAMDAMADLFSCGRRVDRCPHADCTSPPILLGYDTHWVHYTCANKHSWSITRPEPAANGATNRTAPDAG
jgi:phosphotransferase system HPr-like phosphotransfer protein